MNADDVTIEVAVIPAPLLDWFAGQAMIGIIAKNDDGKTYEQVATESYCYAQAMTREKAKQ